ncbi:MAG: hypothetical protein AB8B51_06835 [Sedimentitalea sp.]
MPELINLLDPNGVLDPASVQATAQALFDNPYNPYTPENADNGRSLAGPWDFTWNGPEMSGQSDDHTLTRMLTGAEFARDHMLISGTGFDEFYGGWGDELISTEKGDDCIASKAGDDVIFAGRGDDIVFSGDGADTVFGRRRERLNRSGCARQSGQSGCHLWWHRL